MSKEKHSNKQLKKDLGFKLLFILTPVIASLILMAIQWIIQGFVALPGIKWNDEAAYIKLIETYASYISPKGYWGFDSNHALLGTGSAWNYAILAPYSIIGKFLPVGYSFVYLCNMAFIMLANFAFMLLVKPNREKLIKLTLIQVTSAVLLLYLNTNMSEIYRYALVILIAGLLYRIFFDKCPVWIKYIITPLVIIYSIQVYTFFAFCIPIYVFAIMPKKKWYIKLLVSFVAMGVIAGGSYVVLHMISSNYNIGKTEHLLNALKSGQIIAALRSFKGMVYDGVVGVLNLRYYIVSNGIYVFHVLMAAIIVICGIVIAILNKSKKDQTIGWIVAYSVCIFMFMYMTLYTILPDTFMRGTEIVILFSLYLLMMTENKWLAWAFILINAIGLLYIPVNYKTFYGEERYYTKEELKIWDELDAKLDGTFEMVKTDNPYDNTILMYTMEPKAILAMPKGYGINFVLNMDNYGNDSKYIFMTKHEVRRTDWIEHDYKAYMDDNSEYMDTYYDVIYEDNEYLVFKKK